MTYRTNKLYTTLKEASDTYYATGVSPLSDKEFDHRERELIESLMPKDRAAVFLELHGYGGEASSGSVLHSSIDALRSPTDLECWFEGTEKPVVVTEKFDGLSLSLHYENGILKSARTRGGHDVISVAVHVKGVSVLSKNPDPHTTIGEVVCSYKSFNRLTIDYPGCYTTTRGAASGILQGSDKCKAKYLTFLTFDKPVCVAAKLSVLEQYALSYHNTRSATQYPTDGLVLKSADGELRKLKMYDREVTTTVQGITFVMGNRRVVTPIAVLKPVIFDCSTIRKASLHNVGRVIELGIKPGDEVVITKAGDIIPQVVRVSKPADGNWEMPKDCPCCGKELTMDNSTARCDNADCETGISGGLLHWFYTLGIQGVGSTTVRSLVKAGITKPAHLYTCVYEDVMSHLTETRFNILQDALDSVTDLNIAKVVAALGVRGIGYTKASSLHSEGLLLDRDDVKRALADNSELFEILDIDYSCNEGHLFVITGSDEGGLTRSQLTSMAIQAGHRVQNSVSKKVNYLVACNGMTGTRKVKDAMKKGIPIISVAEFKGML